MSRPSQFPILRTCAFAALLASLIAPPVAARPDEVDRAMWRAVFPDSTSSLRGRTARPAAVPDIYGPGAVLNVGNIFMKVTNIATLGNPFNNSSSDPSMQWPGASGVEYMSSSFVAVGGVNPTATDPNAIRRVSYYSEWRPPSLDAEDRIYKAYDGITNGQRLVNDDGDFSLMTGAALVDEDFLDGRDNDGDKKVDEDFGALGQQMFTCRLRDDTPAALNSVFNEKHIPLGLEIHQTAWAYSVDGYQNFNPVEFIVYNRSGHMLDSLFFGLRSDGDCGPNVVTTYYADDVDVPWYPGGDFMMPVSPIDPMLQLQFNPATGERDSLCTQVPVKINGLSVVDDDGDEGRTPGVFSVLLLGCTTDPLGIQGPARTQFRAVRSYVNGTPYTSGGGPSVDQQRYEFLSGTENVDQETGLVTLEQGEQTGDYASWFSVGPFCKVPPGGSFQVTVAFAVERGGNEEVREYRDDYRRFQQGLMNGATLFQKYPVLANAYGAQIAYNGVYETPRPGFEELVPDCHGCETGLKLLKGATPETKCANCGGEDQVCKTVTEFATTWFNFDCDYCTGVWDEVTNQGFYLRRWNAESPPPNPALNVAAGYNYSDNPDRTPELTPSGDNTITLAWDNLSETTADPKTLRFDFRTYRLWKVSGWKRPVGAAGPNDDDWALLGEYRLFDYAPNNKILRYNPANPANPDTVCPTLWIPQRAESMQVCLESGDLWDRQSGLVIRPDTTVDCIRRNGQCVEDSGLALGSLNTIVKRTRYPVGRYRYVDHEVKNGFQYFYAVTAGDSSAGREFFGRVAAVEAEAVTPQASTASAGAGVWVVPNPYRGYTNIAMRPSAWDLTPNASDPTGTHVDFMGLPSGSWRIRIYTLAGDLVAELHHTDAVNADIRVPVVGEDGAVREGVNRQQDHPNDGQARWNLISRNGQDVVSGIYLFVVDSAAGIQRGKFVIIR